MDEILKPPSVPMNDPAPMFLKACAWCKTDPGKLLAAGFNQLYNRYWHYHYQDENDQLVCEWGTKYGKVD